MIHLRDTCSNVEQLIIHIGVEMSDGEENLRGSNIICVFQHQKIIDFNLTEI